MVSQMNTNERVLKLEGAYNVRDLGGYQTADGRITQWGRVFRADGLHKLSEQDQQVLVSLGIRTVVDLRHTNEIQKMKNVFADSAYMAYHNISLINPATTIKPSIQSLGDMYVNILDECQPLIRRVFELLLTDHEKDAALFHCTAGKDRTGIISALLLDLVGVPYEVIMDDYAMTAYCIAPLMDELRDNSRQDLVPVEALEKFLGCDRENMLMMLAHLKEAYGGGERYLLAIGLSEPILATLKRKLLEN
jgi:protein-tyrosine phosphatase